MLTGIGSNGKKEHVPSSSSSLTAPLGTESDGSSYGGGEYALRGLSPSITEYRHKGLMWKYNSLKAVTTHFSAT